MANGFGLGLMDFENFLPKVGNETPNIGPTFQQPKVLGPGTAALQQTEVTSPGVTMGSTEVTAPGVTMGEEAVVEQPPSLDQRIENFREAFPLGQSDLSIPANSQKAFDMFRGIVDSAGGDFDGLLAEIGPLRMLDRIREFIGKGDTLNQSGIIQIGGGKTLQSLRDLADFSGGGAGLGGPGAVGDSGAAAALQMLSPDDFGPGGQFDLSLGDPLDTGVDFSGGQGDELSSAIENLLGNIISGGAASGGPDAFGTGALGEAGEQGLINLIETGGLDPNLLFQVRQSLREQLEGARQAGLETIGEQLAGRGIGGAGIEADASRRLNQNLLQQQATALRDVATQMGLSAADRQLSAAQSASELGQRQRQQDIDLFQQDLMNQMRAAQLSTDRSLGQAGVALENLAQNRLFAEMLFNQGLATSQFLHAVEQAKVGNTQNLLSILLNMAQGAAGGFVPPGGG